MLGWGGGRSNKNFYIILLCFSKNVSIILMMYFKGKNLGWGAGGENVLSRFLSGLTIFFFNQAAVF